MRSRVTLAALGMTVALAGPELWGQGGGGPSPGAGSVFIPAPGVAGPNLPAPPRDRARASAKGTASLRGRITAAGTSTPLRRAQVAVTSADGAFRFTTTTNGEGRFEALELPAGRYTVSINKGGYVGLQYGQRRPFEPGTQITLADGQALTGIDVALPRGSVIAGRVTDEFGEPVAQAQVSAMRYIYGPDGQRRLQPMAVPATSDDLGQFRLHSLMPGEYIVSATYRTFVMSVGVSGGGDTSEGFLPTYYPGTANVAEAQAITVMLGQETPVQFALTAARMARVSGVVVDSNGRPIPGAMVALVPAAGFTGGNLTTSQTGAEGAFTITNVPPGDYVANVQRLQALAADPDAANETAAMPLSVGGSDLDGVRIATAPGAIVSGQVEFEGTAPRTSAFLWRVLAQSTSPAQMIFGGAAAANGVLAEDGTFQLQVNSPVGVLLRVTNSPQWALKSVTVDGEDITDTPLDLRGKSSLSGVRIVLTDKLTTVSGRALDDRGRTLTDYMVVIQPEESMTGVVALRYLRIARPDQSGSFKTTGLPPGRYVATAVESLEQNRHFVPDVQARLKDRGRTFSLAEGGSATVDLRLATGVE